MTTQYNNNNGVFLLQQVVDYLFMFCPTTRIRTASREAAERTLVDKLCYNNTGNMVEGGFLYGVTNILTIGRAMVQTKKLHVIWKQCSTVPAISFYVEEKNPEK